METNCFKLSSIIGVLYAVIFIINNVNSEKQMIVLHYTNNTAHFHMTYTDNIRNLTEPPGAGLASACSETPGIWMYYTESNYSPGSDYDTINSFNNVQHCVTLPNASIGSIRHIGHSDLKSSGISLYNNSTMKDGSELYFEGELLTLPSPSTFGSYGFTGFDKWTLIEGGSNTTTCLALPNSVNNTKAVAGKDHHESGLITYKENVVINFTTIMKGCMGNENETLVPDYNVSNIVASNNSAQMGNPGLNLTIQLEGGATGQLILIGTKVQLLSKLQFTNYSFIGDQKRNWTIHSGMDFLNLNDSYCLIHGSTVNSSSNDIYFVGAIQLGCIGDPQVGGSNALRPVPLILLVLPILVSLMIMK